jgi:hypothetical protein
LSGAALNGDASRNIEAFKESAWVGTNRVCEAPVESPGTDCCLVRWYWAHTRVVILEYTDQAGTTTSESAVASAREVAEGVVDLCRRALDVEVAEALAGELRPGKIEGRREVAAEFGT